MRAKPRGISPLGRQEGPAPANPTDNQGGGCPAPRLIFSKIAAPDYGNAPAKVRNPAMSRGCHLLSCDTASSRIPLVSILADWPDYNLSRSPHTIYPSQARAFRAFRSCDVRKLKYERQDWCQNDCRQRFQIWENKIRPLVDAVQQRLAAVNWCHRMARSAPI